MRYIFNYSTNKLHLHILNNKSIWKRQKRLQQYGKELAAGLEESDPAGIVAPRSDLASHQCWRTWENERTLMCPLQTFYTFLFFF